MKSQLEQVAEQGLETMTEAKLSKPWNAPEHFEESEVQLRSVSGSLLGIVLAGSVYPTCGFLIGWILVMITSGSRPPGFVDLISSLFVVTCVGAAFGAVISTITGAFSIGTILLMNWSLGYPVNARTAAISAGSMAGYMPTVWVLFEFDLTSLSIDTLAIGFFGPLLAMSLGALGAAWASRKYSGYDLSILKRRRKHKFSILNLMAATLWVALTFSIANLLGGLEFAIAVAGWFFLQAILLFLVNFVPRIVRSGRMKATNETSL